MDFFHRTPFFRFFLSLALGIVVCQFIQIPQLALYAITAVFSFLLFAMFFFKKPNRQFQFRWVSGIAIYGIFLITGYTLSSLHKQANQFSFLNRQATYQVEIIAPPIEKAKSFKCKTKVIGINDTSSCIISSGKVLLYIAKNKRAQDLVIGDRLIINTKFVTPQKPLNPDGFNYTTYLQRQGIGATAYIDSTHWRIMGHNESFSILKVADKCQKFLLEIYRKFNIRGDEFAVLGALTLGYTDDLQPDLMSSYSATGAMHILSVSGMHVGIIYVVLAFCLVFLNKSRQRKLLKAVLIITFLWAYAFITGLSAAVVRAAIMFTFVTIGASLERKSQIYNTIFASAFLMLLFNPNLLFDVSFQLSYSAVLSIVFFQPIINKIYLPEGKIKRYLWDLFAVSFAAQIGTIPFTLYYFHQFPNYFILTNFVAIPLSGIIIYLAIALLMINWIPYVSSILAIILNGSVAALNFLIGFIQDIPYSVSHISLGVFQSIFFFAFVFFISAFYYQKTFAKLTIALFSLLIVVIISLSNNIQTLISKSIMVYAGQKGTHVSLIDRNSNRVYTTDSAEIVGLARTFWSRHQFQLPILSKNIPYSTFYGKRIMILTDNRLNHQTSKQPLIIDYLIIGNRIKPDINAILACVKPTSIIVDRNISDWYTHQIKEKCDTAHITFYAIAEKGYFQQKIE